MLTPERCLSQWCVSVHRFHEGEPDPSSPEPKRVFIGVHGAKRGAPGVSNDVYEDDGNSGGGYMDVAETSFMLSLMVKIEIEPFYYCVRYTLS